MIFVWRTVVLKGRILMLKGRTGVLKRLILLDFVLLCECMMTLTQELCRTVWSTERDCREVTPEEQLVYVMGSHPCWCVWWTNTTIDVCDGFTPQLMYVVGSHGACDGLKPQGGYVVSPAYTRWRIRGVSGGRRFHKASSHMAAR